MQTSLILTVYTHSILIIYSRFKVHQTKKKPPASKWPLRGLGEKRGSFGFCGQRLAFPTCSAGVAVPLGGSYVGWLRRRRHFAQRRKAANGDSSSTSSLRLLLLVSSISRSQHHYPLRFLRRCLGISRTCEVRRGAAHGKAKLWRATEKVKQGEERRKG